MSKIIISNNNEDIGFTINVNNKELVLMIPSFIRAKPQDEKETENEIFYFYRLLKRYKENKAYQESVKERDYYKDNSNFYTNQKIHYSLIELYFSLIEDFRREGMLFFKKKDLNINTKGTINWKKTIDKNFEMILANTIVFNRFYYNNIIYDYDNIITILYYSELLNASNLLNIRVKLPYNINSIQKVNLDKLIILRKYKDFVFSDRERKIYNILQKIFDLEKECFQRFKQHDKLYYVEKFNMIWEEMCRQGLLINRKKYDLYYSKGVYKLFYGKVEKSGYNPQPDIVFEENFNNQNYLLILDAKNYTAYSDMKFSLPGTYDLSKQYMYKFFMSKEYSNKNKYSKKHIINAFLFPGILKDKLIDYIGVHHFNAEEDNCEDDILCFHVDFYKLREQYMSPKINYSNEIIHYIIRLYDQLLK